MEELRRFLFKCNCKNNFGRFLGMTSFSPAYFLNCSNQLSVLSNPYIKWYMQLILKELSNEKGNGSSLVSIDNYCFQFNNIFIFITGTSNYQLPQAPLSGIINNLLGLIELQYVDPWVEIKNHCCGVFHTYAGKMRSTLVPHTKNTHTAFNIFKINRGLSLKFLHQPGWI